MTSIKIIYLKNHHAHSPAMTVSCRLYLEPGLATFGKSFNFRPLSFSSPLRCASSRILSRLLVNCFCMWPLMFDATIAMLHFIHQDYEINKQLARDNLFFYFFFTKLSQRGVHPCVFVLGDPVWMTASYSTSTLLREPRQQQQTPPSRTAATALLRKQSISDFSPLRSTLASLYAICALTTATPWQKFLDFFFLGIRDKEKLFLLLLHHLLLIFKEREIYNIEILFNWVWDDKVEMLSRSRSDKFKLFFQFC